MTAKRLALVLLLAAAAANAQWTRQKGSKPGEYTLQQFAPAIVSGTVSSVAGNIINVANGTVSLDAGGAKIVDTAGATTSLAAVTTGSLIVATVKSGDIAMYAPIPVTLVAVSRPSSLTLTGTVTAVDAAHNAFTLLGRTVEATFLTSFASPFLGASPVRGVADLKPNDLVSVQANPSGQSIVAVSVLLMSMHVDRPEFFHGTVQSIAADAWVISDLSKDILVSVNAQTQIVGNPQVGSTVDVLALRDSSGKLVAISIIKSLLPIFQLPH